jgi:hypothetical protein
MRLLLAELQDVLSDFPDVELGAIRGGNVDATDHLEGFL